MKRFLIFMCSIVLFVALPCFLYSCKSEVEEPYEPTYEQPVLIFDYTEPPVYVGEEASGDYVYEVYSEHAEIKKYEGAEREITLPTLYKNLPVTAICGEAFSGNSELSGVNIPENIRKINTHAFSDCTALSFLKIEGNDTELCEDMAYKTSKSFYILGEAGSSAEKYADSHEINFFYEEKVDDEN